MDIQQAEDDVADRLQMWLDIGDPGDLLHLEGYHVLEELPRALLDARNVERLSLRFGRLRQLPDWFSELAELRELSIWMTPIETLGTAAPHLQKLERIDFTECELAGDLPAGIDRLPALQALSLRSCGLVQMPPTIHELDLEYLDLGDNHLTDLPSVRLGERLRSLLLYRNPISTLPQRLAAVAPRLEWFGLEGARSPNLPNDLTDMHSLKLLSLTDCDLSALPEDLGRVPGLEILDVSKNRLRRLPASLFDSESITKVDARANVIETLPEIGNCPNLAVLRLEDNRLSKLPTGIDRLVGLQHLLLDRNQLTTIPQITAALSSLRSLKLRENPLDPALIDAAGLGHDGLTAWFEQSR